MSKEKIMEMFALRLEGLSLEEIAKRFGVSREWVRQCLYGYCKGRRGRPFKCVYIGLKHWIIRSEISMPHLFEKTSAFKNISVLRRCLAGEQRLTMEQIKDLMDVTGMTFEEAFEREKPDEV